MIVGTQQIIAECWKIVNQNQKNPEEGQEQGYKIAALHVALEGNVLKSTKQQYGSVEEALTKSGYDHDHDYDYGP